MFGLDKVPDLQPRTRVLVFMIVFLFVVYILARVMFAFGLCCIWYQMRGLFGLRSVFALRCACVYMRFRFSTRQNPCVYVWVRGCEGL